MEATLSNEAEPMIYAKRLLTPEDVAVILSVSIQMVAKLARTGQLRACKVGYLWRFSKEDIEQFILKAEYNGRKKDQRRMVS